MRLLPYLEVVSFTDDATAHSRRHAAEVEAAVRAIEFRTSLGDGTVGEAPAVDEDTDVLEAAKEVIAEHIGGSTLVGGRATLANLQAGQLPVSSG